MSEIRQNSPRKQWRYCPTYENPADITSRGIKATALRESSLWLHGPEFLSKESAYWPIQPVNVEVKELSQEFCELKSAKPTVSSLLNTLLSHFWKRWQKEYLTELRVHYNCNSSNKKPTIKIGDAVCVYKDKAPRQLWSMFEEYRSRQISHYRTRWLPQRSCCNSV